MKKLEIEKTMHTFHGCSGCTNPQIFGISPFAPADFEASSTMCTCCFETQSSPGCNCTRRSEFLKHSLTCVLILEHCRPPKVGNDEQIRLYLADPLILVWHSQKLQRNGIIVKNKAF